MTEENPRYDAHNPHPRDLDGVQQIGDVIEQLIEDGPLRHLAPAVRTNGAADRARTDRHGDG